MSALAKPDSVKIFNNSENYPMNIIYQICALTFKPLTNESSCGEIQSTTILKKKYADISIDNMYSSVRLLEASEWDGEKMRAREDFSHSLCEGFNNLGIVLDDVNGSPFIVCKNGSGIA